MNKLIVAPVVAILAAGAAASAAGFAGGVTSAPIQSGDSNSVRCARSATVEWAGFENNAATVTGARVTLTNAASCAGEELWVAALDATGANRGQGSATLPAADGDGNITDAAVSFQKPVLVENIERARVTVEGK